MKRPAFQFYPGDWLRDPGVRSISFAARGLWTDMLCLMHESDRRGYLQLNGKPVNAEQLARMTGGSTDDVSRLLQELDDSGVFSRSEHGIIYSRRMVRDERKREKCVEAGKRGGNPTLKGHPKGRPKGESNRKLTPSSSTSVNEGSGGSARGRQIGTTEMQAVADAWNMLGAPFKPVRRVHDKRRKHLTARLADPDWSSNWQEAMRRMTASAFCRGSGDKGWIADFDWFIRPNSVTAILEGKYDERQRATGTQQHRRETHAEARERGNFDAIRGFAESHGVSLEGLFGGDDDARGTEADGGLHASSIEGVARRVGHVQARDD